jgi:hypothetical protein|tara:strand:+ start:2047 stop:2283 length:237 start_codon:yes stop_codon:yes gene_type:complete
MSLSTYFHGDEENGIEVKFSSGNMLRPHLLLTTHLEGQYTGEMTLFLDRDKMEKLVNEINDGWAKFKAKEGEQCTGKE